MPKDVVVKVRVTEAQRAQWQAAADGAGQTVAGWLRWLADRASGGATPTVPKPAPPLEKRELFTTMRPPTVPDGRPPGPPGLSGPPPQRWNGEGVRPWWDGLTQPQILRRCRPTDRVRVTKWGLMPLEPPLDEPTLTAAGKIDK